MKDSQPAPSKRSFSKEPENNFARAVPGVLSAATMTLEMLQEELHKIPLSEKQEYLEALEHTDRAVLEREVDPSMFLRREANDVKAAARRMVTYWKYRVRVFGPQRAYFPILDLSGSSSSCALTEAEINLLRLGSGVMLPDDVNGRKVLCYDDDRFPTNFVHLVQQRVRCCFYWLTACAVSTPLTQTDGIVVLRLMRNAECYDHSAFRLLTEMIETALPVRLHTFHACCMPSKELSRNHFIKTFLPLFVQMLGKTLGSRAKLHAHQGILQNLLQFGLTRDGLPATLDGNWSYASFEAWFQQETTKDTQRASSVVRQRVKSSPPDKSDSLNNEKDGGFLASLAQAAEQARTLDRRARKRQMDAMYARKRRVREKNDEKEHLEEAEILQKKNEALQRDNERLEQMLVDCRGKIEGMGGSIENILRESSASMAEVVARTADEVDSVVIRSRQLQKAVPKAKAVPQTPVFLKPPPASRKLTRPVARKAMARTMTIPDIPTKKQHDPDEQSIAVRHDSPVNEDMRSSQIEQLMARAGMPLTKTDYSVGQLTASQQREVVQQFSAMQQQDALLDNHLRLHQSWPDTGSLVCQPSAQNLGTAQAAYLQGLTGASLMNQRDQHLLRNHLMMRSTPQPAYLRPTALYLELERRQMANEDAQPFDEASLRSIQSVNAAIARLSCLGVDSLQERMLLQSLAKASAHPNSSHQPQAGAALGMSGLLTRTHSDTQTTLAHQFMVAQALNDDSSAQNKMQQLTMLGAQPQQAWPANQYLSLLRTLAQSNTLAPGTNHTAPESKNPNDAHFQRFF